MTIVDRSGPGVRITLLESERAPSGEPVDLAGRIIAFTFEDSEKKADQVSLQLDNFDLALFERTELIGGATLEVSWGYPGNMVPPRRVVGLGRPHGALFTLAESERSRSDDGVGGVVHPMPLD